MTDILEAKCITIQNCTPDCKCQAVHVVMEDADGEEFAVGTMTPEIARNMAAELLHKADIADAAQAKASGRVL